MSHNAAASFFQETFPTGYTKIAKSSSKLLSGLRAIIATIEAMHPNVPRPNLQELLSILRTPSYARKTVRVNLINHLTSEQLATILLLWGKARLLYLQLEYANVGFQGGLEFTLMPTLPRRNPRNTPPTVVWIHSNNLEGIMGSGYISHWSGMKPQIPLGTGQNLFGPSQYQMPENITNSSDTTNSHIVPKMRWPSTSSQGPSRNTAILPTGEHKENSKMRRQKKKTARLEAKIAAGLPLNPETFLLELPHYSIERKDVTYKVPNFKKGQ